MRIRFTKMHGAGNDFVVLDETQHRLPLTPAHYRYLADRHRGVGADQILSVRPPPHDGVDFEYVIHNADGGEVEQCGNGSRCFVRYVHEQGLTTRNPVRVQVKQGQLELRELADGRVQVDMGAPAFEPARIPFLPEHAQPEGDHWRLALPGGETVAMDVVSMGNPHAVQRVDDVDTAPVASQGPLIEHHPAFPQRVNAGFLQVQTPHQVRLRVFERGSGETLACGTGACAAVVAGIRRGWLASPVEVQTRGGALRIEWTGEAGASVFMTGPATTVFHGELEFPPDL
ncbi:MAG: diaminopimelate epimerase [Limnohabitans sp.]|nr:diaminopimelate epimerase [Limnohabitans sp.]